MRECVARSLLAALLVPCWSAWAAARFDDKPATAGEWGFRPAEDAASAMNPPGFAWRPQSGARTYELQVAGDAAFGRVAYSDDGIRYNCHCPSVPFGKGTHFWRVRFIDGKGSRSAWSRTRSFTIGDDARVFPMPPEKDLIARIPESHPRLFLRPEQLPELRELAKGARKEDYARLLAKCRDLMKRPPDTKEPPLYPKGIVRGSDDWRKIWWGNRTYTIRLLDSAATLAFTWRLGGDEAFGQQARRWLMAAAAWDPKGSTGYRYNDEAGMPYNYLFSRTYTFVNDLLNEEEKETCRRVMRIRGKEMHDHLNPRHLWRPYASHSNRAWHFLGEIGVAFHGEIPEADDWTRFALNVFYNVYPVWNDSDGGWHEGAIYWSSYINRFLMWADVMKAAMDVDAYNKPYFSQVGYYPLYLMPPGTKGGGFGDLNARRKSSDNLRLMAVFAGQARNPWWQWYVERHGGRPVETGYIEFLRGAVAPPAAKAPEDLPSSRLFAGVGQAVLNSNLLDAKDNVELIFKSSPFGTQSHGYESQNAFLLYAYGERLLIRTGYRDNYGSDHHKNWMWQTKSVNCVTVDGAGQLAHSPAAKGEITAFHTSGDIDLVRGEAGGAYGGRVDRFTRDIVFLKPGLVLIHDRLAAPKPVGFEWRLHSPTPMVITGAGAVKTVNGVAAAAINFLHPNSPELAVTDRFDPPPRERVKLVEWHLTARPRKRGSHAEFVTAIRPHRSDKEPWPAPVLREIEGGLLVEARIPAGRVEVFFRSADAARMDVGGAKTEAEVVALKKDAAGRLVSRLENHGGEFTRMAGGRRSER